MKDFINLPAAPDIERGIISAMLVRKDLNELYLERLTPSDFFGLKERLIFETLAELKTRGAGNGVREIFHILRERGKLDEAGGMVEIGQRTNGFLTIVPEYAIDQLKKTRTLRILATTFSKKLQETTANGADHGQIIDDVQKTLADIEKGRHLRTGKPLRQLIEETSDRYEERQKNPGTLQGIPSGFNRLDATLGGFQKQHLTILAARPGMGKSAFMLNASRNAAGSGHGVAIFSLEMGDTELTDRLVCMEARIDTTRLRDGRLSPADWERIATAQSALYDLPLLIDDSGGLHIIELGHKIRATCRENKTEIVFVDYLQLIRADSKTTRNDEVGQISQTLKSLAKECNIPVIALSQLSRQCENRDNKRPKLADLRDSGNIEQDADDVLFLYRDEYYTRELSQFKNVAELSIEKQRSGANGRLILRWHPVTTLFTEFSPDEEKAVYQRILQSGTKTITRKRNAA